MIVASAADRAALAVAIAHSRSERLRPMLYDLLAWQEPEVIQTIVQALARDPADADLDRLLGLLGQPHARNDIRRIFLAAGARGLDRLVAALEDPRTSLAVRQHLPRTISRFGSRRAAAALVDRLPREPDATTTHKILRALGRMRTSEPGLPIAARTIREFVRKAIGLAARYAVLADAVLTGAPAKTPSCGLLVELLREEYDDSLEHAFRALGILLPTDGIRDIYEAIVSGDEARRSAAHEILEACAPTSLRGPLLALIDARSGDALRPLVVGTGSQPFASYDAVLAVLLDDASESVRCVAAYDAVEHGAASLRGEIARLQPTVHGALTRQAFDQAIARLDVRP